MPIKTESQQTLNISTREPWEAWSLPKASHKPYASVQVREISEITQQEPQGCAPIQANQIR